MITWTDLKNKLNVYRKLTGKNALSTDDVFYTMYQIADKCEGLDLSVGMSVRITYSSYAAMIADTTPVDPFTGRALRHGQFVCVANTQDASKNGIYRYIVTGWEFLRDIGDLTSKLEVTVFDEIGRASWREGV